MKVIDFNDSTHEIKVIPRYYTENTVQIELINEVDRVTTTTSNSYTITDGIMTYGFTHAFIENDKYQFTLLDGSTVIYRGKLIATAQTTQAYKLTNGMYTYE